MNTIAKIIKTLGGIESFTNVRIEVAGYMPLCIERIGIGPTGRPLFSVAHYGEQNGDAMRDPDIEFELGTDFKMHPCTFRNDYMNLNQRAMFKESGRVLVRPRLVSQLRGFLRTWGGNIRQQGFLAAAEKLASVKTKTQSMPGIAGCLQVVRNGREIDLKNKKRSSN